MTKKITNKLLGSIVCLFLLVAVMVGGLSVMESADSGGKYEFVNGYNNISETTISRIDTSDNTIRSGI